MISTSCLPGLRVAGWIVGALAFGSVLFAAPPDLSEPVAGVAALDIAFRFASAIEADPKDQARAQAIVIDDYLTLGAIDRAASQAEGVRGWRRGIVYAEIASRYARDGATDRALEWIEKAESFRRTIPGWENPQISARVALALAEIGDIDRARQLGTSLVEADSRQYTGLATAVEAIGFGASGEFEAGMHALAAAAAAVDFEITWWRTQGYLEIARSESLSPEQRMQALEAGRISSEGVAGWRRVEALVDLSHEFVRLDRQEQAREVLEAADSFVLPIAPEFSERAPLLVRLGQAWARLGDIQRARTRLTDAASAFDNTMDIEQPGIRASIAAGFALIGDPGLTRRHFDAAFAGAESLTNARPRALAVVAICRQIGLAELPLDPSHRERLAALFEGLHAPW